MLRLLCGSPGSGKTHRILTCAAETLRKTPEQQILFLVPEQETVSAESHIFSMLPPSAPLSVEVDNFSRLTDSVLRRTGGVCRTHIGRNIKRLCLFRALGELGYGRRSAEMVGSMLSLVNELTAAGATPEKLAAAATRLAEHKHLSELLREYSLLSSFYSAFVSELGADTLRDGELLCTALTKKPLFAGADVYIDGFTSFTGIEYEIISRLIGMARSVTVTLGGDPEGSELWLAEIRGSAARLTQIAEQCGVPVERELLGDSRRKAPEAILRLSSDLWRQRASKNSGISRAVRLVSCRMPMEEAEFVASDIAHAVRDGLRYADIAVVCRSADMWRGVLDTVLAEHRIPAFVSNGFRLEDHPAVRFLCRACRAAAGYDREDIAALLKTDCVPLSPDECDQYLKYAETWRLSRKDYQEDRDFDMNPEGFRVPQNDAARTEAAEILAAVNRVRCTIRDLLYPLTETLAKEPTVRDCAEAVFLLLKRSGLREKLCRDAERAAASGDARTASECAAVWNAITDGLDALVYAAGEETVSADDLGELMQMLFADTEISAIPTSADAVTVGDAERLRIGEKKRIYLIGLSEGEFPAAVKSGRNFFSRTEEALLAQEGISLSEDTEVLAARELYLVRRAVSYATETLVLSYHRNNTDGSEALPGSAVSAFLRLFPDYEKAEEYFDLSNLSDSVWDRRGAEIALYRGTTCPEDLAALEAAAQTAAHREIPAARRLSPESCELLFPAQEMNLTQSRLETYAGCRFLYFCRYLLGLREDASARFDSSNAGSYVHAMLERLVPRMRDGALTGETLKAEIDSASREYLSAVCPKRSEEDPKLQAQLSRLKESVVPIAEQLASELSGNDFLPFAAELRISDRDPSLPRPFEIALSSGKTLRLFGLVDRVDALPFDKGAYVRVVDYKTYEKTFRLADVEKGTNLQLLIYLFTLCEKQRPEFLARLGCPPNGEIRPGGMLYCVTRPPEKKRFAPPNEEEYAALMAQSATLYGVLQDDSAVLGAMKNSADGFRPLKDGKDSSRMLLNTAQFAELREKTCGKLSAMAERLLSGDIDSRSEIGEPTGCDYCPYGAVCRKNRKTEGDSQRDETLD